MTVGSYGLNCTNERVGSCYCSSRTNQTAKFELHCPSYTPADKKINTKLTAFIQKAEEWEDKLCELANNAKNLQGKVVSDKDTQDTLEELKTEILPT